MHCERTLFCNSQHCKGKEVARSEDRPEQGKNRAMQNTAPFLTIYEDLAGAGYFRRVAAGRSTPFCALVFPR